MGESGKDDVEKLRMQSLLTTHDKSEEFQAILP